MNWRGVRVHEKFGAQGGLFTGVDWGKKTLLPLKEAFESGSSRKPGGIRGQHVLTGDLMRSEDSPTSKKWSNECKEAAKMGEKTKTSRVPRREEKGKLKRKHRWIQGGGKVSQHRGRSKGGGGGKSSREEKLQLKSRMK